MARVVSGLLPDELGVHGRQVDGAVLAIGHSVTVSIHPVAELGCTGVDG